MNFPNIILKVTDEYPNFKQGVQTLGRVSKLWCQKLGYFCQLSLSRSNVAFQDVKKGANLRERKRLKAEEEVGYVDSARYSLVVFRSRKQVDKIFRT